MKTTNRELVFTTLVILVLAMPVHAQEQENDQTGSSGGGAVTEGLSKGLGEVKGLFSSFGKSIKKAITTDETTASDKRETEQASFEVRKPVKKPELSARKSLVADVQRQLARIGIPPGPADGLMGLKTQQAIKQFQKRTGLEANGKPTRNLLAALRKAPALPGRALAKKGQKILNIENTYYGESNEINSYEGALTADDLVCKNVVDTFKITGNLAVIGRDLVKNAGQSFKNLFNKDKTKQDVDDLLKAAKNKAKKLNWMPMGMELKYGSVLHKQREKADDLIPRNKRQRNKRLYGKADKLLEKVLSQVTEEHEYKFKLYLTNDDEAQAEALPGGYLYVSKGALDSGYGELVLGHEIAHVLKRHQTRELQARLIDSIETTKDLKRLMSKHNPDLVEVGNKAALLHGLFLNFSRQQELQADACSVRVVSRITDVNVISMIDKFATDLSDDTVTDATKMRSSVHPRSEDRYKRMKEASNAMESPSQASRQ